MPSVLSPNDTFEQEISQRITRRGQNPAKGWLLGTAGAALMGALFAGVSTADFIEHLDRQVHSVHCSFIPGAGEQIGESGCRVVMMSPYSSLFRTTLWGGMPISLLALAVFCYLTYRAGDFAFRNKLSQRDTAFLVTATLLPVGMSLIYGYIAAVKIGALCKLCTGVYISSGAAFVFAFMAHRNAIRDLAAQPPYARWFIEGVVYVGVLMALYLAFAPKSQRSLEGCGALAKKDDPNKVMIDLGGSGAKSIAVLDPLCPACKAFDQRLDASGLRDRLDMQAVLFPLDNSCNWMVKTSLHPGACAVSEAILCDPPNSRKIMAWAFERQEELIAEAKADERRLRDRLAREFPGTKGCLGGPNVKNKLNKSLRWAVANALPVLTPQLFIGDRRVCDEDTDLGLEYTISGMLEREGGRRR
jgi:uncharacterized membrane protein